MQPEPTGKLTGTNAMITNYIVEILDNNMAVINECADGDVIPFNPWLEPTRALLLFVKDDANPPQYGMVRVYWLGEATPDTVFNAFMTFVDNTLANNNIDPTMN